MKLQKLNITLVQYIILFEIEIKNISKFPNPNLNITRAIETIKGAIISVNN